MTSTPTIRADLLRHKLDDQIIVYDPGTNEVHLLDSTTSAVIEMLDKGFQSPAIVDRLDRREPAKHGAELFALALDQLRTARLLSLSASETRLLGDATRRQMIQRIAGLGAALLVPAIITLAPREASAATTLTGNGGACTGNVTCASGCCGHCPGPDCDVCITGSGNVICH